MANWSILKAAIAKSIKNNGNQEITGQVLQNVLNNIVSSVGENATFAGIATPTTNPGTPDGNVFYIAAKGTYPNFGAQTVETGQIATFIWKDSKWTKQTIEIGSAGGNFILDWSENKQTTRLQVLSKYRKSGLMIAYNNPTNGWINEQYVGTLVTDTEWQKDDNWQQIVSQKELDLLNLKTIQLNTYNLIDKSKSINGTIVNTGAINSSPTGFVSDYVYCEGKDKVYGNFNRGYTNFYDRNFERLSTIQAAAEINIPENACFFRGTFNPSLDAYAYFENQTVYYPYGVTKDEIEINKIKDTTATKEELENTKKDIIGSVFLDNKLESPDFSDSTKWPISNGQPFPKVDSGVLDFSGTTARLSQSVPYTKGNNVLVSIEFNSSTLNYQGEVVIEIRLKSGASNVLVDSFKPTKSNYAINLWHKYERKFNSNEITGNVDSVELYFTTATGNLFIKEPIILISELEDLKSEYADTLFTSSKAKSIEGIPNEEISTLNAKLNNLLDNGNFSNGSIGYNSQGVSLSINDTGGIKVTYANTLGAFMVSRKSFASKRTDKYYLYIDIEANDVTTVEKYVSINASMCISTTRYGVGDSININSGERIRKIIVIDLLKNAIAQPAFSFSEEKELSVYIEFTKAIDSIPNPASYIIREIRLFKNLQFNITDETLDVFADIISRYDYNADKTPYGSLSALQAGLAECAKSIQGITELLCNEKLCTFGDSITYQSTWQPHIAAHTGLEWVKEENCVGLHYINIETEKLYSLGLTYNPKDGYYYDSDGEAYSSKVNIEQTITYKKVSDGSIYNTGLTHDSGAKYYTDSSGNKYLLAHTAKGGIAMRPTGNANISIYEECSFAKFYNPKVIILTGGTNDPMSTYGTAEDEPYTGTLLDCAESSISTTVCSAVKGAIIKLSRENPKSMIFLAVPVRGDYSKMGGGYESDDKKIKAYKEARKRLQDAYKAIAEEYGVGYINWNTGIGITDYNLDYCFKDGVHPNDWGGWLMAREAISIII